jgi:4-hydroxy-2-oxoglutarate aldolase
LKLHQQAAIAEQTCRQSIAATKYAAALTSGKEAGIEKAEEMMEPRRPYEAPSEAVKAAVRGAVEKLQKFESEF